MCGVVGYFGAASLDRGEAEHLAALMTRAITHRGPDADGVWVDGPIALGHRRLSILELSPAGAQPMHSSCGRYVMVFNGEIYNHMDLRRSLQAAQAAPHWCGHSDTETLLAGISHWGFAETLVRANGMFAIALWDRTTQKLSLARDRMGEKPLYWGWAGRDLIFGSELKALRRHPDFSHEICREALSLYLRFAYVPTPRAIHKGIYKLEPGTILTIVGRPPASPPDTPLRPGDRYESLSIERYWSLSDTVETGQAQYFKSPEEALMSLETALCKAVERQMISDVPTGAFLSGGIDSSLIVALMQRHSSRPVKTFTIGVDDVALDESPFAAAVATHLGTDHSVMQVTDADARAVIPKLPQLYDEPFADSSQIPTYLVCQAARTDVTVALSGDAGDELFGGYNRYLRWPWVWSRLEQIPAPLRRGLGTMIGAVPDLAWNWVGNVAGCANPRLAIERPGEKAEKLAVRLTTSNTLDDFYRSLCTDWAGQRLIPGQSDAPALLLDDPAPATVAGDPATWMMYQDMRSYLPDDILCKVDRAAMGVSLETRVPFLDPEVIALSARFPLAMKICDGQSKWPLRQILYRYVPRELIERPKRGFAVPIAAWLRGPLRAWAEELLSPQALMSHGLIDPIPVRRAWDEHLSGRRDWSIRLWIILMFQAWFEAQE